jgi:glycosyltransferase 2 family protein
LRLALQAALTATLLAAFADWPGMASALRRADLGPVLAALAVSLLGVLLSAAKWRLLLRRVDITLPFREAARLYWVGMFASNFLPTSVGGDAVRLALTPARDRLALVAGSILVERLTGFMVMLALCALGIALGPWRLPRGLGWLAAYLVNKPGRRGSSQAGSGHAAARCRMRSGSHGTASASGILSRAPR